MGPTSSTSVAAVAPGRGVRRKGERHRRHRPGGDRRSHGAGYHRACLRGNYGGRFDLHGELDVGRAARNILDAEV